MKFYLRPPGVLSEQDFQKRCIHCGQCAQVCNFDCIAMKPDRLFGGETPRVYPYDAPCFLCMKCSEACPTDALRDVSMEESNMGTAFLDEHICLGYQEKNGVMCWTCYERCPMKGKALVLENGYSPSITRECVGCGVCAYVCPTNAITLTSAHGFRK